MHYPGMIVLLKSGRLTSVEQTGTPTARIAFYSEPPGAEIFVDGQLAGTTPATLEVPAGKHEISIRMTGHANWAREVLALAGSETQFKAKLEPKP
jgi:hypothetical protein